MQIGNLHAKARPVLSTFVIACSVVTVGLLFVMQKAEQTRQALTSQRDYGGYID